MRVVARCEEQGSPNGYATFEDEGLNAVLKSIGQVGHRAVWRYRIFQFFENMSQTHAATKRRRSGQRVHAFDSETLARLQQQSHKSIRKQDT